MRRAKRAVAVAMAATCVLSTGFSAYAATSTREAWNNAASSKTTATELSDGTKVYSNVYADETEWTAWKTEWETIRNNFEQVTMTPGSDSTQVNFAWYSHTKETPAIRLTDKDGNPTGITFYGSQKDETMNVTEGELTTVLYANQVTATSLTPSTTYYYEVMANGQWSEVYEYSTESTEEFSLLYVGDPQIGASKGQTATEDNTFTNSAEYYARNDAYNWNHTLSNAVAANPNLAFIMSAGDQINQTNQSKDSEILEQQVSYSQSSQAVYLQELL